MISNSLGPVPSTSPYFSASPSLIPTSSTTIYVPPNHPDRFTYDCPNLNHQALYGACLSLQRLHKRWRRLFTPRHLNPPAQKNGVLVTPTLIATLSTSIYLPSTSPKYSSLPSSSTKYRGNGSTPTPPPTPIYVPPGLPPSPTTTPYSLYYGYL